MPTRPRNTIIPGCLVDAIVVSEPEPRDEAFSALTGSFEIPFDRQQLADYLEVDRSGLSSEIGKLCREGLIENRKSRFTLL